MPSICTSGSRSILVRFTPPRTGTFIYHTHLHDYRPLSSGLYGPLIVVDADETFDPDTDHVIVLGRSGLTSEKKSLLTDPESVVMNGERAPRLVWKARRPASRTPDQHHTRRHLQRRPPVRGTGPVEADRKRRRTSAGGRVRCHDRPPDDRGRRDVRLRISGAEGRRTAWLEVRALPDIPWVSCERGHRARFPTKHRGGRRPETNRRSSHCARCRRRDFGGVLSVPRRLGLRPVE